MVQTQGGKVLKITDSTKRVVVGAFDELEDCEGWWESWNLQNKRVETVGLEMR
jgi:hypothetical protein